MTEEKRTNKDLTEMLEEMQRWEREGLPKEIADLKSEGLNELLTEYAAGKPTECPACGQEVKV